MPMESTSNYRATAILSRRRLLAGLASGFPMLSLAAARDAEVRIDEIEPGYEEYIYRTPIKFGGNVVDRVTLLNVKCVISTRTGKRASGFGSMPLGNVWSFPSKALNYAQTLEAMQAHAQHIAAITRDFREYAHPVEINHQLEPEYLRAAGEVSQERKLAEPIPKLCTLVTASPFDAAIHDAFGKLHARSTYQTYGKDLMRDDLTRYVGTEFRGEWLQRYVLPRPKPRMPMYHLVGAVDPIVPADISQRINDGLPETLEEWIRHNGLTHLKIKLNGDDLRWDIERVLAVEREAARVQQARGVTSWYYSLDFNEKCPNVDYLLEVLNKVKESSPGAFRRIQYVEQPTRRDLKADSGNVMHRAAKLKPVVIDESLTEKESLMLAREMGYSGAALKACKGQAQALLMAAVAQKYKMFLCVQDLTCPGASLIHSVGLAAHVPGVAAIEANSRQYVPKANAAWEQRFPGIFQVKDGSMRTSALSGPGLSVVPPGLG
jgi:L-alanine-DL-glutamate epimerase-like enolase superfamily enzyme